MSSAQKRLSLIRHQRKENSTYEQRNAFWSNTQRSLKAYRVWVHSENRIVTTRDIKFQTELDSDCANTEEVILKDFIEEDRTDNNMKTPANIVEAKVAPNEILQEPNVEMRRAPGRPRIIRTGSCGRPQKEFRLTSSGNITNDNTGRDGDSIHESMIEILDNDTSSNDNEADVEMFSTK